MNKSAREDNVGKLWQIESCTGFNIIISKMRLHTIVKKRTKKAKRARANWHNALVFTAKIQSRDLVKETIKTSLTPQKELSQPK